MKMLESKTPWFTVQIAAGGAPYRSDWITCLPLVVVLVTAACLPLLVVLVLTSLCPAARCEPITLELCMNLPYNQTSFPNFLGHLSQRESSVSWESSLFPALVQTGCYQYLMFYACTLLVPKCDPLSLQKVPPCRSVAAAAATRLAAAAAESPVLRPAGRCAATPRRNVSRCSALWVCSGLRTPTAASSQRAEETPPACCRRTESTVRFVLMMMTTSHLTLKP